MAQGDTSWWDRLIAGLSGKQAVEPPSRPTPPKVDERAWVRNVEMARISPYLGTVHDLGLIIFNETQSNSDRPGSNEAIDMARQNFAHAVINADAKWGAEDKMVQYSAARGTVGQCAPQSGCASRV